MLLLLLLGEFGGLVAMETAATPYISIHCARLLSRATFHHIINTGGVLPPPSKNYNSVICEWQTAAASAVKVRLILPPPSSATAATN